MFRTSLRLADGAPVGVVEARPGAEGANTDLLLARGVDASKVLAKPDGSWWVEDVEYLAELEADLAEQGLLKSKSPYAEFLLEEADEDDEVGGAVDWDRLPCEPYGYQKEAVETAIVAHRGRSVVALKTGSGKTLVGVAFAWYYLHQLRVEGSVLVICPASKTNDWYRDWSKWSGKGTKRITVLSFGMATNRAEELREQDFPVVIVDECHKLKNAKTVRSANLAPLLEDAPALLMLSGTPEENRPSELFNLLHLARPDVFATADRFVKRFCTRDGGEEGRGSDLLHELNMIVDKTMVRNSTIRTTVQPKRRHLRHTAPTQEQVGRFFGDSDARTILAGRLARIPRENHAARQAALRKLEAKIQAMHRRAEADKGTNAVAAIRAIIEAHPGKKIAFFGFLIKPLKELMAWVADLELGETALITGASKTADRDAAVARMADAADPLRFGFFSSCMGEGVTMSPGTHVSVMIEMAWNPSTMQQREDRIYRIGTTHPVDIYWLLSPNSYDDECLAEMIQGKAASIQSTVGGDGPFRFDSQDARPEVARPAKKPRVSKKARLEAVPQPAAEQGAEPPAAKRARLEAEADPLPAGEWFNLE